MVTRGAERRTPRNPRRPILTIVSCIALGGLTIALAISAGLFGPPARATAASGRPRVVVLGFDGADARLVERLLGEGKLPNLARVRSMGAYSPLLPTNPAQTPVSWSSFATGTNPGRTQIFDFLKRVPKTYIPTFALNEESRRPFLFGARNPWLLGLLGSLALAIVTFAITAILRAQVIVRALVTLAVFAVGFSGLWFAAARTLPSDTPWAINNRKGDTFWGIAAKAGRKVEVFRVPTTFPAEEVGEGHMVSGLGVPDLRGTIGRPTYYTSEPSASLGDNEFSLELVRLPARTGVLETRILGPYNKAFYGYVVDGASAGITDPAARREARERVERELKSRGIPRQLEVPLTITTKDDSVQLSVAGQEIVLKEGAWSDWVTLDFPVNWVVDHLSPVRGMVKFQLFSLKPELRLWLSPVNFHPDFHPIPFSTPAAYSSDLAKQYGLFKTIGWTEDTWSLPSGVGDEQHFLEDMTSSIDSDEAMMTALLARKDWDLYVQVYSFTDRIGHLFWRFLDPQHPVYEADKAARFGPEVEKAYGRMDAIVGKALAVLADGDTLVVCSDHGFSSFRRGVNYNTWLVRNGYMTLKGQEEGRRTLEDLFDRSGESLFRNVDWSRTKAYALGLGNIYVNLAGREPQGIVHEGAEYDEVVRGITEGLQALVDEKTNERPVTRVFKREEIYSGYDAALIPDLRVANALNYRVSWQTTLGGVPPDVIEDNLKAWSGDHCSNDPTLVKGIFFSTKPIARQDPQIGDLAPSILSLMDLPIPGGWDGRDLYHP